MLAEIRALLSRRNTRDHQPTEFERRDREYADHFWRCQVCDLRYGLCATGVRLLARRDEVKEDV